MSAAKAPSPEDRPPKSGGSVIPEGFDTPGENPDVPQTEGRDRAQLAKSIELSPVGLVGSHFLRFENGEPIWWGIVVAEPGVGMYLLAVDSGLEGGAAQVVFSLDRMVAKDEGYEFRFFDTEDQMKSAFYQFQSA